MTAHLGWGGVARLGIAQASIGAVVVLMTATLNRIMVVELGLPASVPGALVALHFVVQLALRPKMGHGSDQSGKRAVWIAGGVAVLAAGGVAASAATALMATQRAAGITAAAISFVVVGVGVSAAGTPLLALLGERVEPETRARAAATVWLMMIAGFIVTTVIVGGLLDPFSYERLVQVAAGVGATAVLATGLAVRGLDAPRAAQRALAAVAAPRHGERFAAALREVWADAEARRFALFVFTAMLAYSAQDLILEPFAGAIFGLTPGESTRISGLHQSGSLLGMLLTAVLASRVGSLRRWATGGCLASAAALVTLAATPAAGSIPVLMTTLLALGVANGAFAIGAIGSMMGLAGARADGRAGLRMGVFGAAQAVAYGLGGFAGAAGSDVARTVLGSPGAGYGAVFVAEAGLFVVAAALAARSAPAEGPSVLGTERRPESLIAAMQ
jgi:BCD family chlorophyll transporter-like MFS transporter